MCDHADAVAEVENNMSDDKYQDIANEVVVAVSRLNAVLGKAAENGVEVDLRKYDMRAYGDQCAKKVLLVERIARVITYVNRK